MYPPWAPSGQDGCGALELLIEVCSIGREGRELGQEHTSDCNKRLVDGNTSGNGTGETQGQHHLLQKVPPDKPIQAVSKTASELPD